MRMHNGHEACNPKQKRRLIKIGMFAHMNHISIKTLHFYEEQGLLAPAFVDEANGYRYYTMDQMSVIHQITALKQAGLSLEDIRVINSGVDEKVLLQKKKSQILGQIAELTKQIAVLDGYVLDTNHSIATPVLVKEIPTVTVAAMSKQINSYDELFDLMPEMGAEMERLDLSCAVPEYCFTRYLEQGFKEEQILIETCQAIVEKKAGSEELQIKDIPKITAACIYHKGSYDSFAESYEKILKFIEENGYEICGRIRESYIDGVWNKEREEEWLSEIQIPVKKHE